MGLPPRGIGAARRVEQLAQRGLHFRGFTPHLVEQHLESAGIVRGGGARGALAPLELALEEVQVERGVVRVEGIDAAQRQEVARPLDRVAERPVGLIDARRGLQRHPPRRVIGGGVPIRMHRTLQLAIGRVERRGVDRIARRQAEQLEVVAREVEHGGSGIGIQESGIRAGARSSPPRPTLVLPPRKGSGCVAGVPGGNACPGARRESRRPAKPAASSARRPALD